MRTTTLIPAFFIGMLAAAACVAAAGESAAAPDAVDRREIGSLTYENIPVAGPQIAAAMRRYQTMRSASFQGWLADGSVLIKTRFGQTAQLHTVREPQAARTQITFLEEPVRGATVSPDGSQFVYATDVGGTELYQGYLSRVGGPGVQITDSGTQNRAFVFSRDGRWLAWTRATSGQANWDVMLMRTDDPASRRVVLGGQGVMAPLDFSRDGKKLLLHNYISATASKRFVLDLATGKTTEINPTNDEVSYSGGRFTADGASVLVLSDQGSEFTRLVRFDLRTGAATVLSPADLKWDVEGYDLIKLRAFELSNDGNLLAYSVNDDGRSALTLLDLRTRKTLPVPDLGNATLLGLQFSPDDRKLALTISDAAIDADVWTWDLAQRRLERWTYSEMGGLAPEELTSIDLIRVKSFDGLSIPAFVYRSPQQRLEKAPVILWFHGGPEAQMRPASVAKASYFVNELGAVVIFPNVRGSTGYGRTYSMLDNGRKREDSVKDIGALLDWIETQPGLDSKRVVIYGGSYGGYMTLAGLAYYNERLVGAIDEVGISNWLTFLATTEGYVRNTRRKEYGDEREPGMREFFERISPLNMTDRMKQPLLVIAGANDPRVPKSESDQLVARLRAQGNEVWYLWAKDEGHGFRKRQNQDAQLETETLFLRKVLGLDATATTH